MITTVTVKTCQEEITWTIRLLISALNIASIEYIKITEQSSVRIAVQKGPQAPRGLALSH